MFYTHEKIIIWGFNETNQRKVIIFVLRILKYSVSVYGFSLLCTFFILETVQICHTVLLIYFPQPFTFIFLKNIYQSLKLKIAVFIAQGSSNNVAFYRCGYFKSSNKERYCTGNLELFSHFRANYLNSLVFTCLCNLWCTYSCVWHIVSCMTLSGTCYFMVSISVPF